MDLCLMVEGQEGFSWAEWVALARACEEHSIPALFRSDHYLNLDGRERGSLDAWATLSALAAVTTSLRLGTMVSPATFRHPSVLAKMVATADQISDGRVELGIGAGWHEREHDAYGFPFPSTGERIDVLAEQIEVVLGNWSDDGPFTFAGKHYSLTELDAQPKPVQRPHPPLIMGGTAGPRSAALAARFADEYNTPFPTLKDVRERRGRIVEACERADREPIPFSIMTAVVVGADSADLEARAARVAGVRGGDPDELLSDPPAGWVVGTVEHAAEQLTTLRDAGVARVMCQVVAHGDLELVALLGDELAPRLA
jgi:F420-dependent oxidoreductase-like protein